MKMSKRNASFQHQIKPSKSNLIYIDNFLSPIERERIITELSQFQPIWEQRYSQYNPPPPGQSQRWLLRPVYWLGNWQFACLNYYHPPKGIDFRCVEAEPFPQKMQILVKKIESLVREQMDSKDIPLKWELNTCLINYYGSKLKDTGPDSKWEDMARVGEHKDFEPGPVASVSFGDRALFQFVESRGKQSQSHVKWQKWLEDSSLQVFAGDKFKKQLFHRIQRVDDKRKELFASPNRDLSLNYGPEYKTRRLNLTFRYVPRDHIQELHRFPKSLQQDVLPWVKQLALSSKFYSQILNKLDSN